MKKKLGFTLMILVLTAVLTDDRRACAAPGSTRLVDYYSDATFTVDVGWSFRSCNGYLNTSGQTSAYYVTERDSCEDGTCFIYCTPGPCPAHILAAYPCPEL